MKTGSPNLRRIDRGALVIGGPLPGDIVDFTGRVLVSAGQILTMSTLEHVSRSGGGSRFIYVGASWPQSSDVQATSSDVTPEHIIRAIDSQLGEHVEGRERREHERRKWKVQLDLVVEENAGTRRNVRVNTEDISVSGFGFLFNQFIHPGSLIEAYFEMLPGKPTLTGTVRSCVQLRGIKHRIGVQFESAERA